MPVKKVTKSGMIRAMNATNRAFVRPHLGMPVQFQLRMLQLVAGNGRHVIKLTSIGSVALYAPSSVLLMAKQCNVCMRAGYVLFRALVTCIYMYCSTVAECTSMRERERERERERDT